MTSNALAVSNGHPTALAVSENFVPVSGVDALDPTEFGVMRLKLIQPQSDVPDGMKHMGEWYCKELNEFYPRPRILIVAIAKSRVLFDGKFDRESEPLCRSVDGVSPMPDFAGRSVTLHDANGNPYSPISIGDSCAQCAFAQWGPNREKPACRLNDNWAALLETGDPVIFSLSGSSAATSKQLKTLVRANAFKGRTTWVELGSTLRTDAKGKYYVPAITLIKDEPPAELVEIARLLSGGNLAARAAEAVERAEAEEAQSLNNADDFQF